MRNEPIDDGASRPTGRSSSSSGCRRILDVLRFHVPQVQPRHTIRASGRADVRGPTARIALHATKASPCGICRTMNCRSDPSPAADSLRRIGFPAGIATVRRGAPVRGPRVGAVAEINGCARFPVVFPVVVRCGECGIESRLRCCGHVGKESRFKGVMVCFRG